MRVNCTTSVCVFVEEGPSDSCVVYSRWCDVCHLEGCSYHLEPSEDCYKWYCTPVPQPVPPPSPPLPNHEAGAIVGGLIGAVAILGVLALLVLLIRRRRYAASAFLVDDETVQATNEDNGTVEEQQANIFQDVEFGAVDRDNAVSSEGLGARNWIPMRLLCK
jgi:hypothetical protein